MPSDRQQSKERRATKTVYGYVLQLDVERSARAVADGEIVEYQAVANLANHWRGVDRDAHRRCLRAAVEELR